MAKERKQVGRIRYVEDWHGEGEAFLFEWKWNDEDENQWSLDSAFFLLAVKDGKLVIGEGELISYEALTKIREWRRRGLEIISWK